MKDFEVTSKHHSMRISDLDDDKEMLICVSTPWENNEMYLPLGKVKELKKWINSLSLESTE